ncbi:MAG: TonB-dependent receptor [Acidobacteria bacterium]|nr:TonB-dependent receptor [Acidobacteriota bacterium]
MSTIYRWGALSRTLLFTFCFLLSVTLAFSQERTGTLQGVVLDPAGATVPNATVEVTSSSLLRPVTATTDNGGGYLFGSLPGGLYVVNITAPGFRAFKAASVAIQVGRTTRIDAKLEVGQVAESVVVSGEGAAVDTATNVISANITADIYDRLPKGRSFDTLIALAPGARAETKGGGYQIDGASGSENVFIIDGTEVTNIQTGVLNRQNKTPIEFIGETQIKSSGVDAQFGGAIGGVIAATTKSGSNNFHGQASLYLESDALNAGPRRTLRLNPNNDDVAEYFQNSRDGYRSLTPGFTFGGPIKKDRIWFFLGTYPQFERTERAVTFLSNNTKGVYQSKVRQDYTIGKIDFAPTNKLRGSFSYMYMPTRTNGLLPGREGTDAFSNPWADRGSRQPSTSYQYQADYTATSRLLISVFGGRQYNNNKDYGIPGGTRYTFVNSNRTLPATLPVPSNLLGSTGNFTPNNQQTVQDIFTRNNVNTVASYLFTAGGQHNIRGGWSINKLSNSPVASTWPDGYIRLAWNLSRNALTRPGSFRGPYGYYINRVFATTGDVSSNNQGLFIQDQWRVNKKLTLTLGLRTEREFVPSFSDNKSIPSKAITFNWNQKLAPRLGFAYDPSGTGKMKIYGSFGRYYDIMKYELPRGSFGGDKWKDYYYTLDSPNFFAIKPNPAPNSNTGTLPGTLIETVDNRIPSNDPSNPLVDPNLLPVRQTAYDFGYDYLFEGGWVAGVRYTHKQLDRTIEDVGILTSQGEQYYITNPGFGYSIDASKFPKDYPKSVTPKAKRNYDAVEFRLERRFAKRYYVSSSYTVSRLYGNYGGLASSDENGRTSPNVNRYFDEAWMSYDNKGTLVEGRLATDRPNTFKFFGSYDQKWKGGTTRIAPFLSAYSGTPITTEVFVSGVPVFTNGRGDQGRTPFFSQTDMLLSHDFPLKREGMRVRFELNVTNLFNQATVTNKYTSFTHTNDGGINFDNTGDIFKGFNVANEMKTQEIRRDPQFGMGSAFQGPRTMRVGFHFFF